MKIKVEVEVDSIDVQDISVRDLFMDALYEFAHGQRENAEHYVATQYSSFGPDWRQGKVREVQARTDLANCIHRNMIVTVEP